jgi:VIT1/CCC1 family predicted Fe2+/Mn2+ transporter
MRVVPIVVIAFTVGFGALLGASIAESGVFGPIEAVGLLILAMFAFGAVGALRHPPER